MCGYICVCVCADTHACIMGTVSVAQTVSSVHVCVCQWVCESAHVSMNAQSQAHGLHRDLVNPKHFCSHKAGKLECECMGPSVRRCGQTWVGPWVRGRYFLNSEDELRSKESPDPSPLPLSLQDLPLWASPPLPSAILSLPASPGHHPRLPPHPTEPLPASTVLSTPQGSTSHLIPFPTPPREPPLLCR